MNSILTTTLTVLLLAAPLHAQLGPDYERPDTQTTARYKHAVKWRDARPLETLSKGDWWRVFNEPKLNELISRASANNQNLRAAIARFDQARATARVARGYFFPTLSAAPVASRQETSGNIEVPFPINGERYRGWNIEVPLDLTYEIDFWGKIRREFEATRGEAIGAAATVQNVLLTIQAEVAQNYFRLRAIDGELSAVNDAIGLRREALDIVAARVKAGAGNELEQAQAETELATAQTELAGLKSQRDQLENAIAILCGVSPSEFRIGTRNAALKTPPAIPAGVPSDLLERRPDVASAERALAATTARIGVARSLSYPSVKLIANGGFTSGELSNLFDVQSSRWAVGPSISVPLFAGGRNRAVVERAKATSDEALANYRAALLAAFGDVENSLSAIANLREQSEAQTRARTSAEKAADLAKVRYESGTGVYIDVIDANRTVLTLRRGSHQLAGQRMLAAVSLIKALGGGWSQQLPVEIPAMTPDPASRTNEPKKGGILGGLKSLFSKKPKS
jgi:outer membrane protein, multidrug efflux system